ncbi:MAG: hypothetical protein LBD11_01305 [Candidatus Peribacteria bacterium]|jgi:hypothetical protein|nr:hypothetical protein [Candidatus Peribacteria bacterium]
MDIESVSYASSTTPDSSLTIGGVKIEGGSQIKNKIKSGLKQGLREIIIDKWLDPQIRYIANNFTKMNISLKRPDFGGMGSDIQNTRDTIKTL